jgi:hypothetical protein
MPLVEETELLQVVRISRERLRYLRDASIIPYIRTGRLSLLYDIDKVVAALQKLEQKPGRKREKRKTKKERELEAMRASKNVEIEG